MVHIWYWCWSSIVPLVLLLRPFCTERRLRGSLQHPDTGKFSMIRLYVCPEAAGPGRSAPSALHTVLFHWHHRWRSGLPRFVSRKNAYGRAPEVKGGREGRLPRDPRSVRRSYNVFGSAPFSTLISGLNFSISSVSCNASMHPLK